MSFEQTRRSAETIDRLRKELDAANAKIRDLEAGATDTGSAVGTVYTNHHRDTALSLRDHPLLFLDLETTGLDPLEHEILEIAAVLLDRDGAEVASFEQKVTPACLDKASLEAIQKNGYTREKWADASSLGKALDLLTMTFCALPPALGRPLVVGQNVSFDRAFLTEAYRQERRRMFEARYWLDTASMAWAAYVAGEIETISLVPLAQSMSLDTGQAHTAMGDVRMMIPVYQRWIQATRDRFGSWSGPTKEKA
jgi:DNA polymerase III alpha subunit (gram-positive type)